LDVFRIYRDAGRARQIINVFFRFGFEHILEHTKLLSHVSFISKIKKKSKDIAEPRRFVMALQELGPTFIKLGQLLSTRPDILPKEYFEGLKDLQDNVEPLSYEKIKPIIQKEIGLNNFSHIDENALASASLSQVHKAVLKTGENVVIKVLKPDIEKTIEADIDILGYIAHQIETHNEKLKVIKPKRIVEEFKEYTKKELDLSCEADSAKRFGVEIGNLVKIPRIYDSLSTKRVLVMEYIKGEKLSGKAFVKPYLDCFFKQIFEFGFFHADPHQGNILITKVKRKDVLAFLDFGIVGRLTNKQKTEIVNILISAMEDDSQKIVSSLLKIGMVSKENINTDNFSLDIENVLFKYKTNLGQIKIGSAFKEILEIANKYHVQPPKEFLLLSKCMLTIEGVCLELDPDLNLVLFAKPYAKKYFEKRMMPKDIKKEIAKDIFSAREALTTLPSKLVKTIDRLESGDFKIHFEHNIENSISTINKTGNTIALGMIISAYIVASTLFLVNNIPPYVGDYSLIGVLGLFFSLFFSVVLMLHLERGN
jgi:ubiquinone biosynthesis protein